MKLPNVISSLLLSLLLYGLNWVLSHIGQFSIPPEYLAIATGLLGVAITAIAKLVQESGADTTPTATARGEVAAQKSLVNRVWLG